MDRLSRPVAAGGCLNAASETFADRERYLFFAAEQQPDLTAEHEFSPLGNGNLVPRQEQGRVSDAKNEEHGKHETRGIGSHVETTAVVSAPAHAGGLEIQRRAGEGRGKTKAAGEGHPTSERGDEKHDGAPEDGEKENGSERILMEEVLHGAPQC